MKEIIITGLITAAITSVFSSFGFLISKIYYKSYEKYINFKCKIAEMFTLYANILNTKKVSKNYSAEFLNKFKEVSNISRKYSAEIDGYIQIEPKFEFWISKKKLKLVSGYLIGISNTVNEEYDKSETEYNTVNDNKEYIFEIKKILRIN